MQILRGLDSDSRLDEFRSHYEKVLVAVRRSHGKPRTYSPKLATLSVKLCLALFDGEICADNEKRLAAKCKLLNEELRGASARVTAALRLSEEDQLTIAALRKELEKHWKQIDSTHDKARPL